MLFLARNEFFIFLRRDLEIFKYNISLGSLISYRRGCEMAGGTSGQPSSVDDLANTDNSYGKGGGGAPGQAGDVTPALDIGEVAAG